MALDSTAKLEMKGISKRFPGVKALDDVSFRLRKGTVHVLCGENGAGKSTLMKVLNGIYRPDSGEILIDGRPVQIDNPIHARSEGIAMIFQELSFVPDLTIAENIFLGRWPMAHRGRIDWDRIRTDTQALLEEEGIPHRWDTKLRSMSVSDIQMIEILKAVNCSAEIIIMDEPTSALTEREVERLFGKIEELKQRGVSIVYISHKMDEIFRIADDITVFRDGVLVGTKPAGELTIDRLVEMMVGRKIENQYPAKANPIGDELLRVEGLERGGLFRDVGFRLCRGEIVGFAGMMGAGRTEIMNAVFGLDRPDRGDVYIKGERREIKNVRQAIAGGMAMVSEDRRRSGIVAMRDIRENAALASLRKFLYGGRWHRKKEYDTVAQMCRRMNVKAPSLETPIASLSGGNQQKVILAKWMICEPDILIVDEPTRGIDVGAKSEIYELMVQFVGEGKGVVMVSSELPELIGVCDRIYVVREGEISGMLTRNDFSQEAIMKLAVNTGYGSGNPGGDA